MTDFNIYSFSERIFKKYEKDKQESLNQIALEIEKREKPERNFWLNFESLKKINSYQFTLLVIIEWLHFEELEDFESALYFNLKIVNKEIEETLFLSDFALNLKNAFKRQEEIYSNNKFDKIYLHNNFLLTDIKYTNYQKYYFDNKNRLIENLYEFVKKNIKYFP